MARSAGRRPTAVCIEAGTRRVFACAVDWPGWCRSGKDEERALEALAAAAKRYAVVAAAAGVPFPPLCRQRVHGHDDYPEGSKFRVYWRDNHTGGEYKIAYRKELK